MDINIALIKYHNDNSTNKMYDEIEFCYKRHWEFVDGKFVVFRWDLDTPKPTEENLMKYTTEDIDNLKQVIEEVRNVKFHKPVTVTEKKDFLTSFATNGTLIYEKSTKKLFIFIDGELVKV